MLKTAGRKSSSSLRKVLWGAEETDIGDLRLDAAEAFGMDDIALGSFIYAWFEIPIERPPPPNLQAW